MRAWSGNHSDPPLCCSASKQTPKVKCFVRVGLIELHAIDQNSSRCGAMPRKSRELNDRDCAQSYSVKLKLLRNPRIGYTHRLNGSAAAFPFRFFTLLGIDRPSRGTSLEVHAALIVGNQEPSESDSHKIDQSTGPQDIAEKMPSLQDSGESHRDSISDSSCKTGSAEPEVPWADDKSQSHQIKRHSRMA